MIRIPDRRGELATPGTIYGTKGTGRVPLGGSELSVWYPGIGILWVMGPLPLPVTLFLVTHRMPIPDIY